MPHLNSLVPQVKVLLLVFLLTRAASSAFGQIGAAPMPGQVLLAAEQMPEFPGGEAEMYKFLYGNFIFPEEAAQAKLAGTLVATFVVQPDGRLTHVDLLKKLSPRLDQELVRVVSAMPAWKPGLQGGKPVAVRFNVPFRVVPPEKAVPKENTFFSIDEVPEFPGGLPALWAYLKENNVDLESARKAKPEGKLEVNFFVNENGKVERVHVYHSLLPIFDKALTKAFENMPAWKPGKLNGRTVPVNQMLRYELWQDTTQRKNSADIAIAEKVYIAVEQMPAFKGGKEALLQFLNEKTQSLQALDLPNVEGRLVISFVVNLDGELSYFEVIRGVHTTYDQGMVNILKQMPNWIPGMQNKRQVNVKTNLQFNVKDNTFTLLGYW